MNDGMNEFEALLRREYAGRFDSTRPVWVTRAPGRLDFFGGIIDYTGGTVCETPIAATLKLALQRRDDRRIVVVSRQHAAGEAEASVSLDQLFESGAPRRYGDIHDELGADPAAAWIRYVAGAWPVLVGEGLADVLDFGATIVIDSHVPQGGGLSSSAALEMATLAAVCAEAGVRPDYKQLARLGQIVENRIVGAPCGLMDQLTVTLGLAEALLVIRCQPDEILGTPRLPDGVHVTAVGTGVRHSVGGGEYTAARCAAFMAHRMLIEPHGGLDPYDGLLARVPADEYAARLAATLPDELGGAAFVERYGDTVDTATRVDPSRTYRVRAAADHHVLDNRRAGEILTLLEAYRADRDPAALTAVGERMLASHAGYGACGLGAAEADVLVDLAMAAGPAGGVHGAKITGGGCGGAVAVLTDDAGLARLDGIAAAYETATGIRPSVYRGSVDGVAAYGVRQVTL